MKKDEVCLITIDNIFDKHLIKASAFFLRLVLSLHTNFIRYLLTQHIKNHGQVINKDDKIGVTRGASLRPHN